MHNIFFLKVVQKIVRDGIIGVSKIRGVFIVQIKMEDKINSSLMHKSDSSTSLDKTSALRSSIIKHLSIFY